MDIQKKKWNSSSLTNPHNKAEDYNIIICLPNETGYYLSTNYLDQKYVLSEQSKEEDMNWSK